MENILAFSGDVSLDELYRFAKTILPAGYFGCPNTIDWCGSSGYMGMEHSKNFPPRFSYPPKEESSSIWLAHLQSSLIE